MKTSPFKDMLNIFPRPYIPTEDTERLLVPAVIHRYWSAKDLSKHLCDFSCGTFHIWEETFRQPGHSSPSNPSFRLAPTRPIWKPWNSYGPAELTAVTHWTDQCHLMGKKIWHNHAPVIKLLQSSLSIISINTHAHQQLWVKEISCKKYVTLSH